MVTTSIVKCESIEELNQVVVVEVLVLHLRDLQCHKQKLPAAQSSETKYLIERILVLAKSHLVSRE